MIKKQSLPPSLTEKEKAVLVFIENELAENGIAPSYQEIREHFGFASFNSVQNYIKQLATKGYIEIHPHQKRGILVLHSANTVQKNSQKLKLSSNPTQEILSIPLLGKVAAGRPLESFSHDEFVDVPPSMLKNSMSSFALKVSGDSMIEDGILDGDVILIQEQKTAFNGDVIVAAIENESTVKRYFLRPHPETKMKMIELRPANSTLNSMWYSPDQVDIKGILVGLIRKF